MLYKITQLKAPWPARAVVGDIVDMDTLPAWAVGKCQTATDSDGPTVEFEKPQPVRDLAAELERALQERDDLDQKLERAHSELEWAGQHAKSQQAAIDAALAKSEDLAAQIAKRAAVDALLPAVTATVTGDGTGKALPPADDTEKTGKAKK